MDEGASLAVTLGGEYVVDLWGGTRDYEGALPWERDTLVRVFSTSKVMVIICVLLLYDRGLLDLDAPLAEYWPEFAQKGKGGITTRQVLVHSSGLPGFGRRIGLDEVVDWERMIHIVEEAELWFEPGTRSYYQANTFGYLLGEPIRRISGLPFDEFFRHEIAEPLGADFHFRLPSFEDHSRVAVLWPAEPDPDAPSEPVLEEMDEALWVSPEVLSTAVIPAGSGLANGRSIARIAAMLAMGGELDGRRYLRRATIEEAATEQSYAEDHYVGWCRWGLGFGLDHADFPAATPTSFHWGGYGGSFVSMDMETGMSVGFAPNRLLLGETPSDQERLNRLITTVGEVSRGLD